MYVQHTSFDRYSDRRILGLLLYARVITPAALCTYSCYVLRIYTGSAKKGPRKQKKGKRSALQMVLLYKFLDDMLALAKPVCLLRCRVLIGTCLACCIVAGLISLCCALPLCDLLAVLLL